MQQLLLAVAAKREMIERKRVEKEMNDGADQVPNRQYDRLGTIVVGEYVCIIKPDHIFATKNCNSPVHTGLNSEKQLSSVQVLSILGRIKAKKVAFYLKMEKQLIISIDTIDKKLY